jgi:hypothetical protein
MGELLGSPWVAVTALGGPNAVTLVSVLLDPIFVEKIGPDGEFDLRAVTTTLAGV